MRQLSPEHLATIAATALGAAGAVGLARRGPPASTCLRHALAALLALAYAAEQLTNLVRGSISLEHSLPLHLTDATTLIAVLALLHPRPLLVELTYFWGLTASLQAVLTPDLSPGLPGILYVTFFITHSGAVIAAGVLVVGLGMPPRRWAVARAGLATAAFAVLAAAGNLLTGGNYMFLSEKPDSPSLLDLMGPWPAYIGVSGLVALGLFWLLDAPFRHRRASP